MNFHCECEKCLHRWWCKGEEDPETNAVELTGDEQVCYKCGSEDFWIMDMEDETYDD